MRFIVMFVTAVCVLFLIKLRWPKKKNFYIPQLFLAIGCYSLNHSNYNFFKYDWCINCCILL